MANPTQERAPMDPGFYSEFRKGYAAMLEFNVAYRSDEGLRRRVDGGDFAPVAEAFGLDMPPGMALRVVPDTEQVHHVIMPPNPNAVIADSALSEVSGGSTASSAGSAGSVGCFACSTSPSTISSLGSAGSAGSATGGD